MDLKSGNFGSELINEVGKSANDMKDFNPDSRLSTFRDIEEDKDILGDSYDPDERIKETEYYSSEKERIDQTPSETSEFGTWEGERGKSKFIPSEATESGRESLIKLSEYGQDGIEYKNGEPDFSKCAEATVQIGNMTENRYDYVDKYGVLQEGNFTQADKMLAEQWTNIGKQKVDGTTNWTEQDVASWRKEHKCTWHECCDTKTMHLLSREIHDPGKFTHSGGCHECRIRDSKNVGGIFDE